MKSIYTLAVIALLGIVGISDARAVYDPYVGRWLSRDPLPDAEMSQGPNLYDYVANNPVNLIDPLGLQIDSVDTTIADAIAKGDTQAIQNLIDSGQLTPQQAQNALRGLSKIAQQAAEKAAKDLAASCKKLSDGEIKALQRRGIDPHDLKPNSKFDLFKDPKGDIYVLPKNGTGVPDPTGINVNG